MFSSTTDMPRMKQRGGSHRARTERTLCLGQAVHRVRFHVQFAREFKVVVEFNGRFAFPIVVESFQLNSENGRELLETRPFHGIDLK